MPFVKKSSATKRSCNPSIASAFTRVCGRRPLKPQTKEGKRVLFPWQTDAYITLVSARFSICISPTGSGKSAVQKALAWTCAQNNEPTIVAIPETTIAKSFHEEFENGKLVQYWLPDNTVMGWQVLPTNFLFSNGDDITEKGAVARLVEFIRDKSRRPTKAANILVCTHAALVRAHKQIMAEWNGKGAHPWKGINLFIDEAHHSKALGEEASEEDKRVSNRLGAIVEEFVRHNPSRMMLTTATWLRGDADTIVPPECMDRFTRYELPIDEYLDTRRHLKEIRFRFSIASDVSSRKSTSSVEARQFAETVRKEVYASNIKTLVYQPPIRSGEGSEKKYEYLTEIQRALGSYKPGGDGFTTLHNSRVRSVDLVTPEGRGNVKRLFDANQGIPDVVIVQNLFREGADWPQAARAIVCGARSSLPMIIQMLGRLLRDYEGKRSVEFHIVLSKDMLTDADQFLTYLGTIFLVMALGFQFTVGLKVPSALRSQKVVKALMDECRKKAIKGTAEGETPGDAVRGILGEVAGEMTDEEREVAVKSLLDCMKGAFRVAASALRHSLPAGQMGALAKRVETDPFNAAAGICEAAFGVDEFRSFRESFIGLPEVTEEYVNQQIILHRCKFFQDKGQYVDPRTIRGLVRYFGSAAELDRQCTAAGL